MHDDLLALRHRTLALVLISVTVLAAAILRLWNVGAGIPYAVGVDEPQIMDRAVRMMKTGDFNPHFFDWPSLTIYLHFAVACVTFLIGAMRGYWSNLDQIGPMDFYLPSRTLTALAGTATVVLIYLAGRRWGMAEALLAAALLAVVPNHVAGSHYVLTDVPTAFFTTLTFVLALRAGEQQTTRAFAWAGFTAGLAASSKYNGLVSIILPLLAGWLAAISPAQAAQRTLVVCGVAAGAFLLGTPYAVFDVPRFLNDYARLAAIFARERAGEPGWIIYLKHLRMALGWPALVLALAGLMTASWRIWRGPRRVASVLLVSFPLVYFSVMAGSYQIYGRYMLPLIPFAALLAAVAVMAAARSVPRSALPRRAGALLTATLVLGVLAVPTFTAIGFERNLAKVDTLELAYRWITEHVPPGSKIVIESRAILLAGDRYRSVNVPSLIERTHEQYAGEGFDYILASSEAYGLAFDAPHLHRAEYARYQTLFGLSLEVATFEGSDRVPGPDLKLFRVRR
jgi:4-amino-4-deoxy-L-arabinose transferase-like glycosyltransferase